MARLPDGYSLNGNLAFQGQPAHGNTVAREMINPSQAQVAQSLQQTQQGAAQNQLTQSAQMASAMALAAKRRVQEPVARTGALLGLHRIAGAQRPDGTNPILDNTGIVLT
jgi:hypothetical protein